MSWKPFKPLLNNCRETTLLILKSEAGRITFMEKVKMRYHLLYCNICRRFRKQSKELNHSLKQYTDSLEQNPPYRLSEEAKNKIKDTLNNP
jgi:hypothetical protein